MYENAVSRSQCSAEPTVTCKGSDKSPPTKPGLLAADLISHISFEHNHALTVAGKVKERPEQ